MPLSTELLKAFAAVTNDTPKASNDETLYGTAKVTDDSVTVTIDGSSFPIPVTTAVNIEDGDRVKVNIKNHEAVIVSNMSSPAATSSELDILNASIHNALVENTTIINSAISNVEAANSEIESLKASNTEIKNSVVENFTVLDGVVQDLKATNATVESLSANTVKTTDLEAVNAEITSLKAEDASISKLVSEKASIESLNATNASITELDTKYADIDLANIQEAAFGKIFSDSGMIKEFVMEEGAVTGRLGAVIIDADNIDARSVTVDKLCILGDDGLYYGLNLNTLGEAYVNQLSDEDQEALQRGLHGDTIVKKSITADKVNVTDLAAFNADIGGFHITDYELYSGVKSSVANPTSGMVFNRSGEFNFGDSENYIRGTLTDEGKYYLELVGNFKFSTNDKYLSETIDDMERVMNTVSLWVNNEDDALTIGRTEGGADSPFKMKLDNTSMKFMSGDNVVAYVTNNDMLIPNATVLDKLSIGDAQDPEMTSEEKTGEYIFDYTRGRMTLRYIKHNE